MSNPITAGVSGNEFNVDASHANSPAATSTLATPTPMATAMAAPSPRALPATNSMSTPVTSTSPAARSTLATPTPMAAADFSAIAAPSPRAFPETNSMSTRSHANLTGGNFDIGNAHAHGDSGFFGDSGPVTAGVSGNAIQCRRQSPQPHRRPLRHWQRRRFRFPFRFHPSLAFPSSLRRINASLKAGQRPAFLFILRCTCS